MAYDPMVIIREATADAESGAKWMVRQSHFDAVYKDLGYVVHLRVGDAEGGVEIPPPLAHEAEAVVEDAAHAAEQAVAADVAGGHEAPLAVAEDAAKAAEGAVVTDAKATVEAAATEVAQAAAPEPPPNLAAMTRPDLNEHAAAQGVEAPEALPNKAAVIDAIAQAAPEPAPEPATAAGAPEPAPPAAG